jgi:hypothetical protein
MAQRSSFLGGRGVIGRPPPDRLSAGRRKCLASWSRGAKKKPTKFAPPVQLQEACDAVDWALVD